MQTKKMMFTFLALLVLLASLGLSGCANQAGSEAGTLIAQDFRKMDNDELLLYYYRLTEEIDRRERSGPSSSVGIGIGGGSWGGGWGSGSGGGVVIVRASGDVTVNGTISAGTSDSGSATSAGGSVNIRAGQLLGSGSISVKAGDHTNDRGAGGGGRIAVVLTNAATFGSVTMNAIVVA